MTRDTHPYAVGIDIGGTGIKGAMVDIASGSVLDEPHIIPTPPKATPQEVREAVHACVDVCGAETGTPVGIGVPAPVVGSHVPFMAHLSQEWVNTNVYEVFSSLSPHIHVLNDADAAGLAELRYGHGIDTSATVIFLTLGTGIGSAIFTNGVLLPNTELGHIRLSEDANDAERWAAPSVRTRENLSLEQWAQRFQVYLSHVEILFNPDIFILGGGISERFDDFSGFLSTRATIVPATLRNHAGIVGAARHAHDAHA